MAITPRDERPVRAVVAYRDERDEFGDLVAWDELSCGDLVRCERQPGGRKLRPHDEPCGRCDDQKVLDEGRGDLTRRSNVE